MSQAIVAITKDMLYAVRLGAIKEYWRVSWSPATWEATLQDVISTLGTSAFHVLLTNNLPPMALSYEEALKAVGCESLSVTTIDDLPPDELMSKIADFLPKKLEATPLSPLPLYQVGSLEDLHETRSSSHFIQYLLIAFAAILVAGGVWLLFGEQILSPKVPASTPTPTPIESIAPSPTPTPTAPSPDNHDYKLQIQNGSGITGLASKLSAKLEGDGFLVKDVGNAKNNNYVHAVLQSKSDTPAAIVTSIQTALTDPAWEESTLPEDSPYDIVIIIGQKSTLAN